MNGTDLLAEFKTSRSDKAFGELVRRYTNLVYSAARRRLVNDAAAEEATQSVFIRLASTAPDLRDDAALAAWLHRTTVHVSIDLWRVESRRRAREEQAAAMQTIADDSAWNEIAPVIDEALNELTDAERQVILLRFFEHKSMRELGTVFGISEDAAKMRVSRALERLRERVGPKAAACGTATLGTMLTHRAVEAAPVALVATLMCISWPVPAMVGAGTGFVAALFQVTRAKLALGVATVAVVGVIAFLATRSSRSGEPSTIIATDTAATGIIATVQSSAATPATETATAAALNALPDPRRLLERVALARERIQSGKMELELTVIQHFSGHTNVTRAIVDFDARKARFENFTREYSYTSVGSDESERKMRELGLSREAAVEAGLLRGFDAHIVSIFDGTALMIYRESDGVSQDAQIQMLGSSSEFITSPQCLGLSHMPSAGSTVQGCLPYAEARYIKLLGEEVVDGVAAWHVHLESRYDWTYDFWIDVARPERLLKASDRQGTVISRFDGDSVLPREVFVTRFQFGKPLMDYHLVRRTSELNVPIPATTWTLAGLKMKVGSAVNDARSYRRIGYWNGSGLSEFPSRKDAVPEPARDMAELLALLEENPASAEAFEAARWILFNTPDGDDVEKAGKVIEREHLQNTNVIALCKRLEEVRYRCSTNLLESFLKHSSSAEVQANACLLLGLLKKEEARFGKNQKAAAQAINLFERVIHQFGKSKAHYMIDLTRKAKAHLEELQRLQIGMTAPDFEGSGFEGEPIRLSDYRGQIVVLVFWCCGYGEAVEHGKLLKEMEGKPVALLGISTDDNLKRARESLAKYEITWQNIWDKQYGPISTAWNAMSYPNIWVLDSKGVIRFRDVRGPDLKKAVETLLAE